MTSHDPPPILEQNIVAQLLLDTPPALLVLSVPVILTYLDIYLHVKGWTRLSRLLAIPIIVLLFVSVEVVPVRCRALQANFNFGVAIAAMKLLDIHILSLTNRFPSYTAGKPPGPALMALKLFTELRYESFTPNPIRSWKIPSYPFPSSPERRQLFYSEPAQFVIHLLIFAILQCLPQYLPVKALGIIFAIYLLWTGLELLLRYRNSPRLFGVIYLSDSLETFWSGEVWHNGLTASCLSLAYMPTTYILSLLRLPRSLIRSCAVVASFSLMGVFHMYAMRPILSEEGQRRICLFFVANGVFTVIEVAVWGKKRDWRRAISAWIIELGLASWTVAECEVADGLLHADWRGLCRAKV